MLCAVEIVATAIAALALAVSGWGVAVMYRQLSVARSSSGGQALTLLAGRAGRIAHPVQFIGPGQIAEVPEYLVKVAVGGPGVFHNIGVHVLGVEADGDGNVPQPPAARVTMAAGDDPIEWSFGVPSWEHARHGWVVVTWLRAHLEGVASEAIAQFLDHRDKTYRWEWFHPRSQFLRIKVRNWARRHKRLSWHRLRDIALYGRWKRVNRSNPVAMDGPVGCPPPRD